MMRKLSLLNFKNILASGEIGRENLIFWGVVLSAILFLSLILWDGYIFYSSLLAERPPTEAVLPKVSFSQNEVTEAIRILDDRAKKFNELLEVGVTKTPK